MIPDYASFLMELIVTVLVGVFLAVLVCASLIWIAVS